MCSKGGVAIQEIYYCPFCGAKLPGSVRDAFFDELEALDLEIEDPALPDEFSLGYLVEGESAVTLWDAVLGSRPVGDPAGMRAYAARLLAIAAQIAGTSAGAASGVDRARELHRS